MTAWCVRVNNKRCWVWLLESWERTAYSSPPVKPTHDRCRVMRCNPQNSLCKFILNMATFLKWNQFGTTGSVFRATNLCQTSNLVSKVLEKNDNQMVTAECWGAEKPCTDGRNVQRINAGHQKTLEIPPGICTHTQKKTHLTDTDACATALFYCILT